MSNELKKAPLVSGGAIKPFIPNNIDQIARMANMIAQSGMAPKTYENDPVKICTGIFYGLEVGLAPMGALQSIAVINGTPALWGDGMLSVVRSSGLLEDIEETVEYDSEGSPTSATCVAKRVGQVTPIRHTWTRAQASRAGLWSKKGPWQEYPDRMLQMRARAWVLRDGFADVLKGLHNAEEMQDLGRLVPDGDGMYVPEERPKFSDYDEGPGVDEAPDPEPTTENDPDGSPEYTDADINDASLFDDMVPHE